MGYAMPDLAFLLPPGMEPVMFWWLVLASLCASLTTTVFGIGGGALLLILLASLIPPAALIPVHGVVQLSANATRAALLRRHIRSTVLGLFAAGSVIGAVLGGAIVIEMPPGLVQMGVGLFVISAVLTRPPRWLGRRPVPVGAATGFLTMFFGATGPFVAVFVKALSLNRHEHVATQAALMTVQHGLKIVVFGMFGFVFGPWLGLIVALVAGSIVGAVIGRTLLGRMSDHRFNQALNVLLVLLGLRLIWIGLNRTFLAG